MDGRTLFCRLRKAFGSSSSTRSSKAPAQHAILATTWNTSSFNLLLVLFSLLLIYGIVIDFDDSVHFPWRRLRDYQTTIAFNFALCLRSEAKADITFDGESISYELYLFYFCVAKHECVVFIYAFRDWNESEARVGLMRFEERTSFCYALVCRDHRKVPSQR